MESSQKADSIVLESGNNLAAFDKEIAIRKQRLTNICDSLKSKNQNYKKTPKNDAFSKIINFMEQNKLIYEDYDNILFVKQEFQGIMAFAKIFNPPTWKIEEKEQEFNDFYTKNLVEVMKLEIMETVDEFDKYIKIGLDFMATIENEIKKKYEEQIKILNNISESLQIKEQNYDPPSQDDNGLNQIIDFLEKKANCDQDLRSIWDVRSHMDAFEKATQLYLDENPCKLEKQNFDKVMDSLFDQISIMKATASDYSTHEYVQIVKKRKQEIDKKFDAYEKTHQQMKKEKNENSMHENTDDEIRKTLNESNKRNETFKAEIAELKKTNRILSQEAEKSNENNKLTKEAEYLKSEVEDLENTNSVLGEEAEKSKENKKLIEEVKFLKSEIEELKKRNSVLSQETEESKENKKLKADADLIKSEIEEMKKKNIILNKQLLEDTEALKSEIEELKKENRVLSQEAEKIKASTKMETKEQPWNQEKEMFKSKLDELVKSLETFKKKNDDLTKSIKNLTTENENLKKTLDSELNKENQNLNLNKQDLNSIKTINKEVLKEYFTETTNKVARLEGENQELKDKNKSFERYLKIHKESLEKIQKQFALMIETFKKGAIQKIANLQKVIGSLSIKYYKLKDKFQLYKKKYEQYNAAYHLMNFVGPMKEFLMKDKESVDLRALYDDIRDSSHLQLQFSLPEKYKHIDRNFIEEKIQILLNNIVRFNQFAKIFFNVLKKMYPEPRSNDVATKKINESFQQIHQELQKIDSELNVGYEEMRQKYNEIKLNDRMNKNYVEIWKKCIFLESETIKRILQLDKNFESLGCLLVEYLRNYY